MMTATLTAQHRRLTHKLLVPSPFNTLKAQEIPPTDDDLRNTAVTMADVKTKVNGEEKVSSFYDDVDNQKKLCDFLRSKQGPPVREALLMEKRVHYMKGTC